MSLAKSLFILLIWLAVLGAFVGGGIYGLVKIIQAISNGHKAPRRSDTDVNPKSVSVSPSPFSPLEIALDRSIRKEWGRLASAIGLGVRMNGLEFGETDSLMEVMAKASAHQRHQFYKDANTRVHRIPALGAMGLTPTGPAWRVELLPGQTIEDFIKNEVQIESHFRVERFAFQRDEADIAYGTITMKAYTRDPYAAGMPVPSCPDDPRHLLFGRGEDGRTRTMSLANVAGVVVGGVPGSGKSAGLTYAMTGILQHPAAQFVVIDGKGGADWLWMRRRCAAYTAEDEDLSVALATVREVHDVMRARLRTQKTLRGNSNFHSLSITPEHPLLVLIVDECQTYFDATGQSKESKEAIAEMVRLVGALIKKGRSAGIVTIVATQKPTADSLPTALRDNASQRVCFRVVTREAEAAVLGVIPTDSTVRATDIAASSRGEAVVADDAGALENVKFGFIQESVAEDIATSHSHLRKPLVDIKAVYEGVDSDGEWAE